MDPHYVLPQAPTLTASLLTFTRSSAHSQRKTTMNARRIIFSIAALFLLGLFAAPIRANAEEPPIQPAEYVDTDGDGLSDDDEPTYGTDPALYDTDGDGFGDNQEVVNGSDPLDSTSVPANGEPGVDTDGDLLTDAQEAEIGTDPTKPDTDSDELSDFAEVGFEPGSSTGTDPLAFDTDGDGLGDGAELRQDGWGTDPTKFDTDGDGFNDGDELFVHGTDPKDPTSAPAEVAGITLIIDVRILPVGYTGNDYVGDSEPLAGVNIDEMMPGSDYAHGGPTDGNGRVIFGGLIQGDHIVALGVPGDFADFITFYGTESIPEPRQHEGQNTNSTIVYIGPGETLYGTFYVIPVDAKGEEPAPAPAPQPQAPVASPAPVTALPNTGAGVDSSGIDIGIPVALFAVAGAALALAAFGTLRHARRQA